MAVEGRSSVVGRVDANGVRLAAETVIWTMVELKLEGVLQGVVTVANCKGGCVARRADLGSKSVALKTETLDLDSDDHHGSKALAFIFLHIPQSWLALALHTLETLSFLILYCLGHTWSSDSTVIPFIGRYLSGLC